jgi:cytochrome oxidase Cu insertion factor (SCO1/SenC/PrrC family)
MRFALAFTLLAGFTASVIAQGPRRGNSGGPLPLQGKMLPDVNAFDDEGNPVSLRQALKGKHGVIVFGCLT